MIITATKAYKYRCYPTKNQQTNLLNQFSMCRYLYNWSLQERVDSYKQTEKTLSYYDQQAKLPTLKIERPWFKGVHSQVLQDVLKRLDKSYQNFFRRVKSGENPGFPKFKRNGDWTSITYPQFDSSPQDSMVQIPKVGKIKIIYHRSIPKEAKIKTLTVSREGTKWFVCFSIKIDIDLEPKQNLNSSIGIDLGLIDFLYASDNSHVETPKFFRKSQEKLAKLQKRFSKAKKFSARWYKILYSIQKCHFRIKCQRKDFLHKTANALLNKADLIVYENLKIQKMSLIPKPKQDKDGTYLPNGAGIKSGLNKSINDAGWYNFLSILKYKAIEQGKQTIGVDPKFTSQQCSACGAIIKKSLSVRTHVCPCGFVANRDFNASLNILTLGLESLSLAA